MLPDEYGRILATEAVLKKIAALPDSTDESLESLTLLDLKAILAMPMKGAAIQSLADYAIPLTLGIHLNDLILVSGRMRHQTKSTSKAVRQHGRLSTIMERRSKGTTESESAVPAADALNKTTGVDRYVRHAGTFGGSGAPSDVRAQNKATVKGVAAAKFGAARVKAYKNLQWIQENMHFANITELNPLKPCDYVIVLKPGSGPLEVLLGIGTRKTRCMTGFLTRLTLELHHTSASRLISLPTPEGYPHTMATLCAASLDVINTMHMNAAALQAAVRAIGQGLKDNNAGEDMAAGLPGSEEAA
ncbi:hypothetical protein R3P38DRAFT_3234295 [Favolaschia claudopus]|uniref:Uncharacterized protein n=1 Tax=Favolaschia claudopus TaxID=2862362 RepID=A0AAV9ZGM4_9AGAR